ncbi:oligopeptide ABC transporter, periplasmic oligopeptide-binding protein OppA [Agrilactobacillus composti DSM 18527 = JCM 14202]|uniref:peptide ABC transporter substrate-binding protein n=1 Tax=Agrilactobacillus composti TaxID=398555 RepID=UPI00042E0291|nr:peptide ABC transporter substrate-binding protein [Agrilactobacillus composti]GAF39816.1 oligopeptide ABC transporter, periplasmic oligopeptide-binding protein OppA [Agrilactobacillus composti DSM 18527 = JCM 14202]
MKLISLDKDKIVPALANRAPVRHGQTYTITLRKNAKWDNGQSVSAQDFVVGFQRLADPKNDANMSFLLKNFKNYNAIQTGAKKVSTLGVKATGKHTLKITLATPISNLAELLTAPSFMPVNTKAVVQFGANYGKSSATTVYNGPFTVNNWDGKSNTFTLVKNPQYWAKKTIHLQQINFIGGKNTADAVTLFQNKQLDVANISGAVAKDWQHNKAYATHKNGTVWYLAVNQKRAALKNAAIRRALSMAINRKEMIQIALQNQVTPALG